MNSLLTVHYQLNFLKTSIALLDPDNTETVWEYYLLENLSCGLLRDSKYSATGYEGCLAEKFYQEDKYTWAFQIRNLKWSNGVDVSTDEIKDWIYSLKSSTKRHIRFLKLAEDISYDSSSRVLKIKFPFEVDHTILHELSLADAGLFPKNYREKGWGVTVGPYKVDSWNPKELTLKLSANLHSHFYNKEMPQQVNLFRVLDLKDRAKLFKDIKVDLVSVNSTASPKDVENLLLQAPQIYTSHPISIIFFVFNKKNPLAEKIENRKFFTEAISELRPQIPEISGKILPMKIEEQMISPGFSGRLQGDILPNKKSTLKGHTLDKILIKVPNSIKDFSDLVGALKKVFLKNGIEIQIEYSNEPGFKKDHFARLTAFLGNQLDPSGSWAFLAGPPYGPLSDWFKDYQDVYNAAFSSELLKDRQENLNNLHKTILKKYLAVPLATGQQRYLLSKNIDPSRWNPFDARMRIYELRWK